MIATRSSVIDVFLSHAAGDRQVADVITKRLDDAGMAVLSDGDVFVPGKSWEGALRKALIQCEAFVLLMDASEPVSPNSNFELGAVTALHKPIFLVLADQTASVPDYLRRFHAFHLDSLDKLVAAIRDACHSLSSTQLDSLVDVYQQLGVPSNRLLSDPLAIENLGEQFRKNTGRRVQNGQLASELLRLRKTGQLPRIRSEKGKN
jgi:TIR domain